MFVRYSVPVYVCDGLVHALAHLRRRHSHHPACPGPNPWTPQLSPRISCTSDPFLLIQEVVTLPGTLESLIQPS